MLYDVDASNPTKSSRGERQKTEQQWRYIPPLPGHCMTNLGDAAVHFSGGRLKPSVHRVVAAPGKQARWTRYVLTSLVIRKAGRCSGLLGSGMAGELGKWRRERVASREGGGDNEEWLREKERGREREKEKGVIVKA